jgi:hypothetical protein
VCAVHFNFISTLNALSALIPSLEGPYSEIWCETAVCTHPSDQCFFNQCAECSNASEFQSIVLPVDASEKLISVSLWLKRTNPVLKVKQMVKEKQQKPLDELYKVSIHCI